MVTWPGRFGPHILFGTVVGYARRYSWNSPTDPRWYWIQPEGKTHRTCYASHFVTEVPK